MLVRMESRTDGPALVCVRCMVRLFHLCNRVLQVLLQEIFVKEIMDRWTLSSSKT